LSLSKVCMSSLSANMSELLLATGARWLKLSHPLLPDNVNHRHPTRDRRRWWCSISDARTHRVGVTNIWPLLYGLNTNHVAPMRAEHHLIVRKILWHEAGLAAGGELLSNGVAHALLAAAEDTTELCCEHRRGLSSAMMLYPSIPISLITERGSLSSRRLMNLMCRR
jgi:hypothetical protein